MVEKARTGPMKRYAYTLTFHTPAFLGGADQSGEWRTPPFKALLRQWWRVVHAPKVAYDVERLRAAEAERFGTAADEKGGKKGRSLVLLRLSSWNRGGLTQWEKIGNPVNHPEVSSPVGPDLYLGYGPLEYKRDSRTTGLKMNAALQAGESARFSLAFPEPLEQEIRPALLLMNRFATAGGRSRNGWGSFTLVPADPADPVTPNLDASFDPWLRPLSDTLSLDWPHAIGKDGKGPLVWRSKTIFPSWREAMVELAKIKIGLRTQFKFTTGEKAPRTEDRHWLSYPVTKHSVSSWGNNARLPNSLRFKVVPDGSGVRAWIFHLPCLPPDEIFRSASSRPAIERVWQEVHAYLDKHGALERVK